MLSYSLAQWQYLTASSISLICNIYLIYRFSKLQNFGWKEIVLNFLQSLLIIFITAAMLTALFVLLPEPYLDKIYVFIFAFVPICTLLALFPLYLACSLGKFSWILRLLLLSVSISFISMLIWENLLYSFSCLMVDWKGRYMGYEPSWCAAKIAELGHFHLATWYALNLALLLLFCAFIASVAKVFQLSCKEKFKYWKAPTYCLTVLFCLAVLTNIAGKVVHFRVNATFAASKPWPECVVEDDSSEESPSESRFSEPDKPTFLQSADGQWHLHDRIYHSKRFVTMSEESTTYFRQQIIPLLPTASDIRQQITASASMPSRMKYCQLDERIPHLGFIFCLNRDVSNQLTALLYVKNDCVLAAELLDLMLDNMSCQSEQGNLWFWCVELDNLATVTEMMIENNALTIDHNRRLQEVFTNARHEWQKIKQLDDEIEFAAAGDFFQRHYGDRQTYTFSPVRYEYPIPFFACCAVVPGLQLLSDIKVLQLLSEYNTSKKVNPHNDSFMFSFSVRLERNNYLEQTASLEYFDLYLMLLKLHETYLATGQWLKPEQINIFTDSISVTYEQVNFYLTQETWPENVEVCEDKNSSDAAESQPKLEVSTALPWSLGMSSIAKEFSVLKLRHLTWKPTLRTPYGKSYPLHEKRNDFIHEVIVRLPKKQ